MRRGRIAFLAVLSACVLGAAARAEVIRHPIPNSTFPIAQAVEVRGNVTTYYVSGQVPPVVNKDADPSTSAIDQPNYLICIWFLRRFSGCPSACPSGLARDLFSFHVSHLVSRSAANGCVCAIEA